jgi:hypothetical protein
MEHKITSKWDRDWCNGIQDRLIVAAQLTDCGISINSTHPLQSKQLPPTEKNKKNTTLNRIINQGGEDGMGADFIMKCIGSSKEIKVLIRWFTDPNIFIKDTLDSNLLPMYTNAIVLFVNKPRETKSGKVERYHVISFDFIKNKGWVWRPATYKDNTNRLILMNKKGKHILPQNLTQYSIKGENGIFEKNENIWNFLKTLFQ